MTVGARLRSFCIVFDTPRLLSAFWIHLRSNKPMEDQGNFLLNANYF